MFRGRADFGFDILGTSHHTNYIYFRHEYCTHTLHTYFIQYLLLCLCFYCNVSYEARSRIPVCVSALRFWILEDSQLGLSCRLLPCLNERFLKNQVSLLGEALL